MTKQEQLQHKYEELTQYIDSNPIEISIVLMASFKTYLKIMFFLVNESEIMLEPFHDEIISELEAVALCKNEKRNLALNVPVGAGKSLIVEYFISWCFARDVNNAFMYLSHSDRLITKLSKETKEIVENVYWINMFQKNLKRDDKSKVNWSFANAKNRTGLFAGTVGGGITGLDAGNPNIEGFSGALIIDDPMDVGKVRYALARKEVKEFYDDKLETRRRTPNTPTILIMQRLHIDDLTAHVKVTNPEEWRFVSIPALKDGVSFWEKRYPAKSLLKMASINPYLFNSQYQQNPISVGGNVIKSEWYKYYTSMHEIELSRLFFTVDTAQKTKEYNDWTVFSLWGVDGRNLYLIDLHRGKWVSPDLRKNAKMIWDKWRTGINGVIPNTMYVEDKSSGTGLIQDLQVETGIPVLPVPRSKDKGERAQGVLPYIEGGRVLLPVSKDYSFVPTFLAESEEFTLDDTHPFDDQLDTMFDAINIGLGNLNLLVQDYV